MFSCVVKIVFLVKCRGYKPLTGSMTLQARPAQAMCSQLTLTPVRFLSFWRSSAKSARS